MQKKTTISDWSWLRLCARQNIFFFYKHIKGSKERFSIYQLGHKHSHDLQKAGPAISFRWSSYKTTITQQLNG